MYYLFSFILSISFLYALPYEEGEYVSEAHQNISQSTCYAGNGYEEGDIVETAVIVTTEANDKLRPIHNRMPVIIPTELYSFWLDPANDVSSCHDYLKPYPSEPMAFYRVSTFVNNVKNDDPRCVEPLSRVRRA